MIIFLSLQDRYKPFIIQAGNTMEWILLLCITFGISLDLAIYVVDTFKEYLISFVIILPLILFIYFMIKHKRKKNDLSMNTFKQRIKYLILWIIHYSSSSEYNSRYNKDSNDSLDIDLQKTLTQMTNITSDYHLTNDENE